ncbi:hypothetical protein HMPREF1503_0089 [Olsenella uli MSTE5]|nr:hypothetical protein HMPREF1503_0089 [Olsenella uli MSTE5]
MLSNVVKHTREARTTCPPKPPPPPYTCVSRFSALFRRKVGMLPSEFRRTLGMPR